MFSGPPDYHVLTDYVQRARKNQMKCLGVTLPPILTPPPYTSCPWEHALIATCYQRSKPGVFRTDIYIWCLYPDEDDNDDDDDEGVDSKFFEETAKLDFFISSAMSNCDDTSTRETLNTLPNKKQNENLT